MIITSNDWLCIIIGSLISGAMEFHLGVPFGIAMIMNFFISMIWLKFRFKEVVDDYEHRG